MLQNPPKRHCFGVKNNTTPVRSRVAFKHYMYTNKESYTARHVLTDVCPTRSGSNPIGHIMSEQYYETNINKWPQVIL